MLLRKLDKAEFTRHNEFRRHVTMLAQVDEKEMPVKIDDLKEYFDKVSATFKYACSLIEGEPVEE